MEMEMEARDGTVRMTVGCPADPSRHARSDLALLNSNTLDTCPPKSASIQNKPAKRCVYADTTCHTTADILPRDPRTCKHKIKSTHKLCARINPGRLLSPLGRLRLATGASPWTVRSLIRSPSGANETFNRPASGALCLTSGVPRAGARG